MSDADLLQAIYDEALARVRRDLGDVAADAQITIRVRDTLVGLMARLSLA